MQKINLIIFVFLFLAECFFVPVMALAYQPRLIYAQSGDINIVNPENFQTFYDELKAKPRDYFINSDKDFELYTNLLVPETANRDGRYSTSIFLVKDGEDELIAYMDGTTFDWKEYYDSFERDYYLKGPELTQQLSAGKYKIEVSSKDNQGKYVLVVGKKEVFDIQSILNIYWQLPLLKVTYLKTSVLQFFLTQFGIIGIGAVGALLILIAIIYYLIGLIREAIKHSQAKTLLLTSNGMQMKKEIIELLQKPAYDITVAFINTAHKYKIEENSEYINTDLQIMRDELGFNVEVVDIEGKKEFQVMKLLELKDIVFVAGGNTFYLLKAMRACNFERIIRKLLKLGKVYIGASAGSIIAGKTIKTAGWKDADKNIVKLRNLKGLNLVPFDIFVHYQPEWDETIKQKIKSPRKRLKKLKILTDDQAILVQGKEVSLIGKGEAIIL